VSRIQPTTAPHALRLPRALLAQALLPLALFAALLGATLLSAGQFGDAHQASAVVHGDTALVTVADHAPHTQNTIRMTVVDEPAQPGEAPGRSAFYLVLGWVVGGYLAATALAVAVGPVPGTSRRAQSRVLGLLGYSVLSGFVGAIVVGPTLEIWVDDVIPMAAFGTLIVFGAAMTAAALQGWLGVAGTGVLVGLLVAVGSSGDGGPVPPELLPAFLRDMNTWLLHDVGTHLLRGAVYFGGTGIARDLVTVWVYGLGGTIIFLLASHIKTTSRPSIIR
jgi:hypothetical protein